MIGVMNSDVEFGINAGMKIIFVGENELTNLIHFTISLKHYKYGKSNTHSIYCLHDITFFNRPYFFKKIK